MASAGASFFRPFSDLADGTRPRMNRCEAQGQEWQPQRLLAAALERGKLLKMKAAYLSGIS